MNAMKETNGKTMEIIDMRRMSKKEWQREVLKMNQHGDLSLSNYLSLNGKIYEKLGEFEDVDFSEDEGKRRGATAFVFRHGEGHEGGWYIIERIEVQK